MTKEDLACLDAGEFLNDVIIDFYLKSASHVFSLSLTERPRCCSCPNVSSIFRFLLLEAVDQIKTERSHVFSSFFYRQLSRRRVAGEDSAPSVPYEKWSIHTATLSLSWWQLTSVLFSCQELSYEAPEGENVDTSCGHFYKRLPVCACQSRVRVWPLILSSWSHAVV